jgi:hypothetical protein
MLILYFVFQIYVINYRRLHDQVHGKFYSKTQLLFMQQVVTVENFPAHKSTDMAGLMSQDLIIFEGSPYSSD